MGYSRTRTPLLVLVMDYLYFPNVLIDNLGWGVGNGTKSRSHLVEGAKKGKTQRSRVSD